MFCINCGKEIETGAKFCKECGAPVEAPAQPQAWPEIIPEAKPKKVKKPFYKRWWVWAIVIFMVAGIFSPKKETNKGESNLSKAEKGIQTDLKQLDTAAVPTTTAEEIKASSTEENKATTGEKNALKKAKSYLDYTAFSYSGLIHQLEFEGFTSDEAAYGVDNCGADWYEQAEKKAKSYLDYSAFSRDGLIHQLEFDGFTEDQAVHGAFANGY